MINIYDDINRLEATMRKTNEFKTLEEAIVLVKDDEEARTLFTNFRDVQMKLQEKQMAGEEILEDEYQHAQKVAQLAQQNPKILTMLEAEMAVSGMLQEVNRVLTKPIQAMYDNL
ncbi:UPF0342 protein YheA [Lysinibacillus alkalisoli]|uniref:UPF0342 protein GCM10007425_16530 n=1 Tax=Lysinibacillus alkalisoli TaxID=1911548 RepID=A0A917LGY4_9BACI|nr:YlbF family regulator [Lysinibacillus alkalisoli]GGG22734.1 UPF0342 protein YheA [Lysinibacillus alkalisoli]